MFVDNDHAGDKVSHRLRSGFLIYVNIALVQWFAKNQFTVETSVFGVGFVAMKQGIDALRGFRHKLRMMGIQLWGQYSVVYPESVLRKKSNSVCYHAVCESVAVGEYLVGHIDHSNFWECDWREFFEGAVEAIPLNSPPPRENKVDLHMFVDSDHAGNKWTKRSRTSFMVYMNVTYQLVF